jgi:hypothetical protein
VASEIPTVYETMILEGAKQPRREGRNVEGFKQAAARARKADVAFHLGERETGRVALVDALRWLRTDKTGYAGPTIERIETALGELLRVARGEEVGRG